ncbi:MAG: DUF1801 domain-containing protein [Anaerolineae bacterium]
MSQTVEQFMNTLSPQQAEIVSTLRALIQTGAPEAGESLEEQRLVYDDHGPIAYIRLVGDEIHLGFWRGGELPDPEGLLQEEQGEMKFVRFATLAEVKKKELAYKYFVKVAARLNREKSSPLG